MQNLPVSSESPDELPAFLDRRCSADFHGDMLACSHAVDRYADVGYPSSRDHNSLDIVALEQFFIVEIHLGLLARFLFDYLNSTACSVLVLIADGDNLYAVNADKLAEVALTASAENRLLQSWSVLSPYPIPPWGYLLQHIRLFCRMLL